MEKPPQQGVALKRFAESQPLLLQTAATGFSQKADKLKC
jgi:hypothetical protein